MGPKSNQVRAPFGPRGGSIFLMTNSLGGEALDDVGIGQMGNRKLSLNGASRTGTNGDKVRKLKRAVGKK